MTTRKKPSGPKIKPKVTPKGWQIPTITKGMIKAGLALWVLVLFYLGCVNYTEPTQIGIARNVITGNMWLQEDGGIRITLPWVFVARIDTRPVRVSVTSAGHGYSGKLVQFEKSGWKDFVAAEGFRCYWWANRLSFNFGYDEEYRGIKDILRGYAYGAKPYPFFVILQEYQFKQ